ncbi:SMI1/KNR4 family protein [Nonomuraea sp. NPDC049480]|uniref:SMI1/KNR4 family protein n=1 Tax=Nonomuraea sp. NPDC049480 TaxID=3364353 RepID=UPI0037978839
MIGLRGRRPLLLGLVAVLMVGGLTGSTAGGVESMMCRFVNDWMSCGDPEHNARMRASMLTPAQARSIGCRPVFIEGVDVQEEDSSQEMRSYPEPTYPGRTPDPAIAARVNQAWARIEQWLGAHASASLRKLRFGAEPQLLAQWESIEGRRLPDDLYASYLRHDGADGNLGDGFQLPGSYGLLGLADLDYISSGNCRRLVLGGDLAAADPEKGQWHGTLLPIGDTGRGQELFVEPRTGRVGEAAYDEPLRYDGPMGWPSHVAMLEALAGALETGGALGEAYPTVTSGCELRWAEEPAPLPGGCAGGPRPTPAPTPEPTPERPTAEEIRATGCRPARRDPVLRSPRWTVTAEVNATWRRIERWLARRAPKTYELLRPPARPATIAKMEAAMGATFPDDLRASLLRHDGVGSWGFGPAPFYALMSAKAIYQDWKMLCGIVLDEPELGGFWWHGRLIPFADAHDGGNLFIDPGTGKTGEYFHEDGLRPDGDATWPSYLALLKATARALETGKPIRGWRPRVTKGELDWEQAGRS